jgi:hypothetical protein
VIFVQHVHLLVILCDFFFWGCSKDKVYSSSPRTEEELKESICREILDIAAENLQKVNRNLSAGARNIYV